MVKPVLPEVEQLRGNVTDEQLEVTDEQLWCCNFVEHETELEESAVPYREGARRMTPNKPESFRKEIET